MTSHRAGDPRAGDPRAGPQREDAPGIVSRSALNLIPSGLDDRHPQGTSCLAGVKERDAWAVMTTGVAQLGGVADLGYDATEHHEPLPVYDVVVAVDRIGRRLRSAVAVLERSP